MPQLTTEALTAVKRAGPFLLSHERVVLCALVVVQWLAILAFALTVKHNGWIYYQGGDQIWYATSGWFIGHLTVPYALVGYGWSLLLAPVLLVTGRDVVSSLPAVIVVNVAVLGPVALVCVHSIVARIAGRALALLAAAVWVAAPFLAIPFFRDDYHDRFVEQFLPQAVGLTAMADFPSMVALLVSAAIVLRAVDGGAWTDWALAGLAAGVAVGMKPANLLFLGGVGLAVLLARRLDGALGFAGGLAASLVTLALWKYRGLGELPAFAQPQVQLAMGGEPLGALNVHRYVNLDWDNFQRNLDGLREWTWSARLLEWIPFAGALAVARRSLPAAGLVAGWFGLFLLVKGTTPLSTVESGSFFRFLMPAYPAYFVMAASIPLLVPRLGIALARRFPTRARAATSRRSLVAAALVAGALPFVVVAVAAARPVASERDALVTNGILTPVDPSIEVHVRADGARRIVTWTTKRYPGEVFFRVFRTAAGGDEASCEATDGAPYCELISLQLATTRRRVYVDGSPPAGSVYRIGVAANWEDNAEGGDVFALSEPAPAG